MGTEPSGSSGRIKVDEHYPSELDEPPPFDVKKIENIRSNVKFDTLYQVTKLLGDGKFGKVYCVIEKETGNEFAAKFIKIRKEADRTEVEREVSILTQLRHPRIAQIYDAFYTTTNDVVLIMEIVRGGELFDRVAEESYELSELAVVMIICQLCEAIDYIHKQNILHLDVKPENIMCVSLTGNRIKLIDFGLARHYDGTQELKYMAGTPEFAAPEVIKFEKLDYHTDMWSIGVITYILLSGYSPFLGDNLGETYCNVEKGVWEFTEEFDTVSPDAKDFVSKLLIYDQRKRMLPHECLKHPWIATHRQKAACNAVLEKPLNAPTMDNKQIMRYNARRKFRRMIIYVKFLIEMNRLRNSLKSRMSANGHKFFDPLLKMAEKKEQKIAEVCSLATPTTSGLNSQVQKTIESKRKGSEASHLSHLGKIQENDDDVEEKEKDALLVKKKKRDATKTIEKSTDGETVVTKKKKPKPPPSTNSENLAVVDLSKRGSTVSAKSDASSKPFKTLEIAENGDVVLKKKSSIKKTSLVTAELEKNPVENLKSLKTSKEATKTLKPLETLKKVEATAHHKSAVSEALKKVESVKPNVTEVPKKSENAKPSEILKKIDALKPVTKEKVKETLSKADVGVEKHNGASTASRKSTDLIHKISDLKKNRVSESDSVDSAKENSDVKRPTRQGALKKRDHSVNVLNAAPSPTTLSKSLNGHETSMVHNVVETIKSNGQVVKSEKVLTKRKSLKSTEEKLPVQLVEEKEKLPKITTNVVNFETKTPRKSSTKIKKLISEKLEETADEKKLPKVVLTTEKKETTTVQTTTSVKRKTHNSEKKVEHSSDGKSVETFDKRKSQQDDLKISQVTTKKEDVPNGLAPKLSVKKSVIKHALAKSSVEKEKKTTETKNDESIVKKTNTLTNKDSNKTSLEQTLKVNGENVDETKVAGGKTIVQKMEVKAEGNGFPRKSSLKKTSAKISETVTNEIDVSKNGHGVSLKATDLKTLKINPDDSSDTSSLKSVRINLSRVPSKKSSIKSHISSASTRDSSEERKKVRFVGEDKPPMLAPKPLFGSGLQKMKSESCLHNKLMNGTIRKSRDDASMSRKGSLFTDVEYEPKEDFSFERLKEKLTRRVSEVYDEHDRTPRKMIAIPPTNSVKDKLKHFEKKFSK